jgi:hypothetical protein
VASVGFFLLIQPLEDVVKKSGSEDHHNGSAVSVDEAKAGNSWGVAAELGLWTFLGTALQVCPYTTFCSLVGMLGHAILSANSQW